MNAIFRRASVRNFLDKPVEEEKIELMLRAAMAAPTARNQQPWEFYVVTDKQTLHSLSEATAYAGCTRDAALAIVPCFRKGTISEPNTPSDMSAATQNILLEATELGLGAVWLGVAPRPERMANVKKVLRLPENLEGYCIIACGYPAKEPVPRDRFDPSRIHRI